MTARSEHGDFLVAPTIGTGVSRSILGMTFVPTTTCNKPTTMFASPLETQPSPGQPPTKIRIFETASELYNEHPLTHYRCCSSIIFNINALIGSLFAFPVASQAKSNATNMSKSVKIFGRALFHKATRRNFSRSKHQALASHCLEPSTRSWSCESMQAMSSMARRESISK